ncbi:MAG: hypothetical protein IPJ18_03640 [Betaproteobacteria bacterium]|nr:hypothetical protein [Betaproteobacteria bacterium]
MSAPLINPVGHLLQLIAACKPGQRVIVGLVGLPGSGKSTLARALQAQVNTHLGQNAILAVAMDGFPDQAAVVPLRLIRKRPWPDAAPPGPLIPQAWPSACEPQNATPGRRPWPGFEHSVGDPVEGALTVARHIPLVLIAGLYLLHQDDGWDVSGLLDECWFLDVPLHTALQRLQARHMAAWGINAEQAQARIAGSDALNAQLVQGHRERADALVGDSM